MHLGLALGDDSSLFKRYEVQVVSNGKRHSESLVPLMLDLCERNGLSFKDLDLLVCTNGPGSFTGLRIGMSALKGISLASGIPQCSVSTWMHCLGASPISRCGHPCYRCKEKKVLHRPLREGKRQTPDLDITVAEMEALMKDTLPFSSPALMPPPLLKRLPPMMETFLSMRSFLPTFPLP